MARRQKGLDIDADDDALADSLVRKRGCMASMAWPLVGLLLVGGGVAGFLGFRKYDAMRVALSAAEYAARASQERIATNERRARDAEAQVERLRTESQTARADAVRQYAELSAERDRLRVQAVALSGAPTDSANLIARLRPTVPIASGDVRDEGGRVIVTLLESALFTRGDATLTPAGTALLARVGEVLHNPGDRRARIEGHTDESPVTDTTRFATNWELSTAQALAVVRYLADRSNVDPHRLEATGLGSHQWLTPPNPARERRIEIVMIPTLPTPPAAAVGLAPVAAAPPAP